MRIMCEKMLLDLDYFKVKQTIIFFTENRGALSPNSGPHPQNVRTSRRQVLRHHVRQGGLQERAQRDLAGIPAPAGRRPQDIPGRVQPAVHAARGDIPAGRHLRVPRQVLLRLRQAEQQRAAGRRQGVPRESQRDRTVRVRREKRGCRCAVVFDVQVS